MGLFDRFKKNKAASKSQPNVSLGPVNQPHKTPEDIPSDMLKAHSRPAWLWHTAQGEGAPRDTRIGANPFMGVDEPWPNCGDCGAPLSFMMQVDLNALPDDGTDHGEGVMRFFNCEQEACVGMGGWDAFDPQHHISILQQDGVCRTAPETAKIHPPLVITEWEKVEDMPHWEDQRALDLEHEAATARLGHKFAGWPFWIQGAERPNCPNCQSVMEPFIQLDEDHTRSFNFGGGIGHISQCPIHKDVLAFGWACG